MDDESIPSDPTIAANAAESGHQSRARQLMTQLHALLDEMVAEGPTQCADAELVEVAAENERAANRLLALGNQQVVEVSDRGIPHSSGYRNLTAFMDVRLRMSDVARRRRAVEATAQFRSPTGERLPPQCPALAQECAEGAVGAKHADTVLSILDRIPHAVAHDVKVAAERQMADLAKVHTPKEIADLGARLLAHLNPDGDLTDDEDRARQRNLWLSRNQDPSGMSVIKGRLEPEARARMRTFLEAWAAPGMNNPADESSPKGAESDADAQLLADAATRDSRTQAQRNHDALVALLAAVQDGALLGKSHRGMPIQLIIKASLSELQAAAGLGVTTTGDLIPMSRLVELAAQSQQWLAVFEDAAEVPLYFGRAKRLATREQRYVSFARNGGESCSFPQCDQPAARVQMHHAAADFAKGGQTNITDLAPACARHNRMVGDGPGKFTTGIHRNGPDRGRCWWRLNAEGGSPPNPKQVNRVPDMATELEDHLRRVRTEIHGDGDQSGSGEDDFVPDQDPGQSE